MFLYLDDPTDLDCIERRAHLDQQAFEQSGGCQHATSEDTMLDIDIILQAQHGGRFRLPDLRPTRNGSAGEQRQHGARARYPAHGTCAHEF